MGVISNNEKVYLNELGIDVIDPARHYWFVRTDGGDYFDDFFLGNYVGIQWNEVIVNADSSFEEIESSVREKYKDESRQGYVAKQIYKFAFEFKKGDIVLIPNKDSKYIAFGELLDDNMYIEDESPNTEFIDLLSDADEPTHLVYKKRRHVRWIKTTPRDRLDPYLKTFIYAHNTIVDLEPYSLFIDRSLSNFYIKGQLCYFSFRVNRRQNIPFGKMLNFLNTNQLFVDYINSHLHGYVEKFGVISLDDFSIKINVQSEGPVQIVGPMKKALAFGLVVVALMGGNLKIAIAGQEVDLESDGVLPIIQEVHAWYNDRNEKGQDPDETKIKQAIAENKQDLQLTAPSVPDSSSFSPSNRD